MGERPDGAELKRTESYQWPSGHIAHLTQSQLAALVRFKNLCQEKGYYVPADDAGKTTPSHDDETMLRYLRARKFIPEQAFGQFKDTEDWRAANQLDALYESIDVNEYEESRRLYPQWTGRRDKRGIPFYVFEVNAVDAKAVLAYTNSKDTQQIAPGNDTPWKMLKLFALYESMCRFVLPLCSVVPDRPHGETPVSQSSNIVDLSGVGFTKIWTLRNHMSDASKLATAHYPETLDRIFIIGAPNFFDTIWSWVQRWFDPITVSKIVVLNKRNMASTLEKFVGLENVPKKYGGTLEWNFGDMPYLDPTIANSLRWKEDVKQHGHRTLPIGPIKWQYDEDGDLVAIAIGTEEGKKRHTVIAGLHPESGVARLALSPGRSDASHNLFHNTAANIPPTSASAQPATETSPSASADPATETAATSQLAPQGDNTQTTGQVATASTKDTTQADTYTVPYRDTANDIAFPPEDGRQGTSDTRFVQQADTHAEGQLAHGTPAIKTDGQGLPQAIVEPKTVGQAPKEHPVPVPAEDEGGNPGLLEQAKDMAGSVMAVVGLGGKKEEEAPSSTEPKHDPEVDAMDTSKVEEYLRSKTMSQA